MGSRLQNTVTYVPLSHAGQIGTSDFVRRENGVFAEWLDELRARRITTVFVQAPWPVEDEWMRARADLFWLASAGSHFRVFAVNAPSDAAGRDVQPPSQLTNRSAAR